jgi:hypothetical protein
MKTIETLIDEETKISAVELILAECRRDAVIRLSKLVMDYESPLSEKSAVRVREYAEGYVRGFTEGVVNASRFDKFTLDLLDNSSEDLLTYLLDYVDRLIKLKNK